MNIDIDYIPSPKQEEAHRVPQMYKLFGGAVGGGKSFWLCAEAIFAAIEYPGNRVFMCRKYATDFKTSTLITLKKLLPYGLIKSHNTQTGNIELINGSVIEYGGLGNAEDVERLRSCEYGLICIDEATEIPYEGFLMCQQRVGRWCLPSGKYPRSFILLASNPDFGWVKEQFIDNPGEDFVFIQSLPTDNPHLPEDYIARLRKTYPEEWVLRFLEGDWNALGGDDKIIQYEWIQAAINRQITIENKPIVSCDPAAYGDDESVIIYGKGNCVIEIKGDRKQDTMVTAGKFTRLCNKHNAKGIIETDGLGIGIYDRIREMGVKVNKFQAGSSPVGEASRKKFYNLKAQAWFHARDMFQEGKVSIPKDDALIRQLSGVSYTVRDSGGKLWVQQKSEYKKRGGKSPDRAEALVMMLWQARFMSDKDRSFTRAKGRLGAVLQKNQSGYGW